MFRTLSEGQKAGIFGLIVLLLAVLVARSSFVSTSIYMATPTVAALLMMLVVTGEGYTREGWKSLGLHRAGWRQWPFVLLFPFALNGIGFGLVLATGVGTYGLRPEVTEMLQGIPMLLAVPLLMVTNTLTTSLGEELGWRGYLLPRLRSLGEGKALLLSGLLWGVWHLPLMLFTQQYHANVNPWTYYPLFLLTLLVVSVVIGYTRLRTDSVWPAALLHSAANVAWNLYAFYYTPTSPLAEYVSGDAGLVQLVGYLLVGLWVLRQIGTARTSNLAMGKEGAR